MGRSCIHADYGETIEMHRERTVKGRKEHRCCECSEIIAVGDLHEVVTGMCDGHWVTYRTCARCVNVRTDYFSAWVYGTLVEDFESEHGVDYRKGIPPHITPCGASTEVQS